MKPRLTFPKNEKLTGETAVNELFLRGESFLVYPIRVVWSLSTAEEAAGIRVLMSVPKKKLKRAVDRNKVKRLLRECYRLHKQQVCDSALRGGMPVRLAFVWIPCEVLEYSKVERKMVEALTKLEKQLALKQPLNDE
jgi:ribonuclease P protein component